MKAKFTDRLRLFFVSILVLNLVLTPNLSYALAPKSHIGNILQSVKLIPANQFHSFLFQKQLTFSELYNEMNKQMHFISPDSLLTRLKHEISKKRIVPILNDDLTVSFKLKDQDYDKKNLMWIFVPEKHIGKTIHSDGYVGSRSLQGTVVAVEKNMMRKNRFLENYLINADEGLIAYANTSSLFRTEPKIFHSRKDKDADIETFHRIMAIFVDMNDEHKDDKKLIDSLNRTFSVMYNMAKEGADITSIFAAIFFEDNIREQISIDTGVPLDQLIMSLVNRTDAPVIMEKIKKAKGIIEYPYEPLETANHAFPNFLYSLIQQANISSDNHPVFGKPDLDILLLGVYNKIAQLDKEPNSEEDREAQLKALNIYGPLVEMLDKNEIADTFRDIYFKYNNPHEYEVLTTAIENVFGMSYSQLTNHLECDIINRLDKALAPLSDKYKFTYRYRVKSLYSLWEKIRKRHTILPDEDMTAAVEALLKDGFLRKDGKERRLDDLYGMQVVFDIPHTLRSESKMKEIQKQVLDLIDAEFTKDTATDKDFKRKEKTIDKHGYREEKIMPMWKDANGVEYRGEIQVLSDKDLKLYKHGAEEGNIQAHWGYKIKERGYQFDDEMIKLIKKLQYLYGHDSHKNFALLSNYLKKHIFTAVYKEATDKEKAHIKYLRLPMKSIIPDVASSSSINMLNPKNAAQVILTRDDKGALKIKDETNVYPSSKVRPGQIFRFKEPKDPKYSFGKHIRTIIQKAQKLSTIVQMVPKETFPQNIYEGKAKLEEQMLTILKKTSKDTPIHEFLNNATKSTLAFFRINTPAELYRLSNIIEHEIDHAILIRIGQHFFNDKLKQKTHITTLKSLYSALKIPKEERTPLRAFATMITADQIGKIKLNKKYKSKLDDKDDFNEIDNWTTRNALKKSAKRHDIHSLHEMRALIALDIFSPLEILVEHYNYNFSYTLRLEGKDNMVNMYNIFMELENLGIKHSPSVTYNKNSVILSLTSPSLSPSEEEQQFIEHKLNKLLPSFNIDSYQLSRPSTKTQKLVRVVPGNKGTAKRLKKIFDFLKIPYTNSGDGALIIKVAKRIPVKIIQRLLEDKLHSDRYTKRTFEIEELLQRVDIKRLKAIRAAA